MLLEDTVNIVYYLNHIHQLSNLEMCSHDSELSVKLQNIHGRREPVMSKEICKSFITRANLPSAIIASSGVSV